MPTPESLGARVDELGRSIEWLRNSLQPYLEDLSTEAASKAWQLDSVELTVSVDLEAETGVIFARAKAAAGFEVKMTWSKS
ncbi:CU044_2847 family protein [Phycicoccus sp. Soil748]|uniref:CU044_2847 family protein n=1 Tax=Phycicoccus sp. Soil748 TaxID=1736397 RepID=UPI003513021E